MLRFGVCCLNLMLVRVGVDSGFFNVVFRLIFFSRVSIVVIGWLGFRRCWVLVVLRLIVLLICGIVLSVSVFL